MRTNIATALTEDQVSAIARSAETVSLDLIRAIDGTVESLQGITKVFQGLATTSEEATKSVKRFKAEESVYLDHDDLAIQSLERCNNGLKNYLTSLVRNRSAIDRDARLNGAHCESLHDAYAEAIDATAELIQVVSEFRSAIIAHDLAAEPRVTVEAHETVQSLIASLKS